MKFFPLDRHGTLLKIVPDYSNESKEINFNLLFILDRSGSMGRHVEQIIGSVLPNLLSKLKYGLDKKFHLITFDSVVEHYYITYNDLSKLEITSRGCTNMENVVPQLFNILNEDLSANFQIVVLSDGEVHDKTKTIANIKKYKLTRTGSTCISLIRLQTSSQNYADTSVISAFSAYANTGSPSVKDINGYYYEKDYWTYENMVEYINNSLVNSPMATLEAKQDDITIIPGQSKNQLNLPVGQESYVLVKPDTDLKTLTLEGKEINFTEGKLTLNEVLPFFEMLLKNIKFWTIGNVCQDDINNVIDFCKNVEKLFNEEKKEEEVNKDVKSRTKQILNKLKKSSKTIFTQIAELKNSSLLDNLNQQQAADFLNGNFNNTSAARSLAKRTCDSDPQKIALAVLDKIKGITVSSNNNDDDEKECFYSCESNQSILENIQNVAQQLYDANASATDVLELVGLTGVPVTMVQQPYPDPWQCIVANVFLGVFLNQSSSVFTQNNYTEQLECHGFPGSVIHGSVPVSTFGVGYKELMEIKEFRDFLNLHASITMRQALAPIPNDHLALLVATLWRLIQMMKENKTEILFKTIKDLVETLKPYKNRFNELNEWFQTVEPGAYFTGINDITSILKLVATLVLNPKSCTPKVIRAMYSFDAYHKARNYYKDQEMRNTDLLTLVSFDKSKVQQPTKPFYPELKTNNNFNSEQKIDVPWKPDVNDFINLSRVCEALEEKDYLDYLKNKNKEFNEVFGTDEYYLDGVILQSIECDNQSDRVNTDENKMIMSDLTTLKEVQEYKNNILNKLYNIEYQKLLQIKKQKEKEITMGFLQFKLMESDFQTFLETLEGKTIYTHDLDENTSVELELPAIKNSSSDGYQEMINNLLENEVKDKNKKIHLVLTGRNEEGEVLWNGGNVYRGNLEMFKKAFNDNDNWEKLLELYSKNKIYRYSESRNDKPNRHGHCNSNPSQWALNGGK